MAVMLQCNDVMRCIVVAHLTCGSRRFRFTLSFSLTDSLLITSPSLPTKFALIVPPFCHFPPPLFAECSLLRSPFFGNVLARLQRLEWSQRISSITAYVLRSKIVWDYLKFLQELQWPPARHSAASVGCSVHGTVVSAKRISKRARYRGKHTTRLIFCLALTMFFFFFGWFALLFVYAFGLFWNDEI